MDLEEKQELQKELQPLENQSLFFSRIRYADPYHILTQSRITLSSMKEVLVVTGIANPQPLITFLNKSVQYVEQLLFSDHHIFTIDDWRNIVQKFNSLESVGKTIITTEKDAVRLMKFANEIKELPLYVMPIEMEFLFDEQKQFEERVQTFIRDFQNKEITNDKK